MLTGLWRQCRDRSRQNSPVNREVGIEKMPDNGQYLIPSNPRNFTRIFVIMDNTSSAGMKLSTVASSRVY